MALPISNLPRKLRGRPRNSGTLKDPERKATISTKLSKEVIDIVELQRANNESISDTILRLIKHHHAKRSEAEWNLEKTKDELKEARKKVEGLRETLRVIQSYSQGQQTIIKQVR
jgi:predicted CopG family antitoxin